MERIIDLCSGAGGPGSLVAKGLAERGSSCACTAPIGTPNHAHLQATAEASEGRLSYERTPIDATNVPEELVGLRTIFNAFHHMTPDLARQILEDAHDKRQPIAIFEVVDRRFGNLVGLPMLPLVVAALIPTLRPFDWRWIPFTYLLPILPLAVWWDGFVSMLRVYQPDELRELVTGLDDFAWDIGRHPAGRAGDPDLRDLSGGDEQGAGLLGLQERQSLFGPVDPVGRGDIGPQPAAVVVVPQVEAARSRFVRVGALAGDRDAGRHGVLAPGQAQLQGDLQRAGGEIALGCVGPEPRRGGVPAAQPSPPTVCTSTRTVRRVGATCTSPEASSASA